MLIVRDSSNYTSYGLLAELFCGDIHYELKSRLNPSEQLTHTTALKAFKQIKWKSKALSILTKPIVLISL